MTTQDSTLETKVVELEARLAALEPTPAPATRTRADAEAELQSVIAAQLGPELQHIAFIRDVLEPAKAAHLAAIAAADATLRQVLDDCTTREKSLQDVRQRVSSLRQEIWQLEHSGGA